MRSVVLFSLVFAAFHSSIQADIAYSNLGPNDEFDSGPGSFVVGFFNANSPNIHYAWQFTAQATGTVSGVDVGVSLSNAGQNDSMLFTLWSDDNGLPGSDFWSGSVDPVFAAQVLTASSPGQAPLMVAGETYWLSGRSDNGTGTYLWYRNSTGAAGNFVSDFFGGQNWSTPSSFNQLAFRVNVNVVPEPVAIPVILLSGMLFPGRRRKA